MREPTLARFRVDCPKRESPLLEGVFCVHRLRSYQNPTSGDSFRVGPPNTCRLSMHDFHTRIGVTSANSLLVAGSSPGTVTYGSCILAFRLSKSSHQHQHGNRVDLSSECNLARLPSIQQKGASLRYQRRLDPTDLKQLQVELYFNNSIFRVTVNDLVSRR